METGDEVGLSSTKGEQGHGILQNTLRVSIFISADDLAENLNLTVSL